MKKHVLIAIIALITTASGWAQQGNMQKMEEIRNLKIAFMTDMLKLTPTESEKFWPIYNEYWGEKVKISHKRRELYIKINISPATNEHLNSLVEFAEMESALIKKYGAEFTKVLSADKAAKTFMAEEKFKSTLLRRTHGGGGQNRK